MHALHSACFALKYRCAIGESRLHHVRIFHVVPILWSLAGDAYSVQIIFKTATLCMIRHCVPYIIFRAPHRSKELPSCLRLATQLLFHRSNLVGETTFGPWAGALSPRMSANESKFEGRLPNTCYRTEYAIGAQQGGLSIPWYHKDTMS